MEHHHLLAALPTVLGAKVVSEWISTADRVRLDSAHCNHSVRKRFLGLNSSPECSVRTWSEKQGPTDNLVTWASLRSVSVANIFLNFSGDVKSNLEEYDSYLSRFGSGVTAVKAEAAPSEAISMIAKLCPNLLVLDCAACDITHVLHEVFGNCPNLQEFSCNFEKSPQASIASKGKNKAKKAHLAGMSCPNLKVVQLMLCEDAALVAAIVKLAVKVDVLVLMCCGPDFVLKDHAVDSISPTVHVLSLSATEVSPEAFDRLVQRCPHIEHMDLSSRNVTVETAAALGAHLKHLKSVDLSFSNYINDEVLLALVEACGDRLTELLLCQCYNLDQNTVDEAVLGQCPNITAFSTHYIDQDGDIVIDWSLLRNKTSLGLVYEGAGAERFISALAVHCTSLQHCSLSLYDTKADGDGDADDEKTQSFINMSCIDALVRNCPYLRTLAVELECDTFSSEDVARWQVLRPGLVVRDKFQVQLQALQFLN